MPLPLTGYKITGFCQQAAFCSSPLNLFLRNIWHIHKIFGTFNSKQISFNAQHQSEIKLNKMQNKVFPVLRSDATRSMVILLWLNINMIVNFYVQLLSNFVFFFWANLRTNERRDETVHGQTFNLSSVSRFNRFLKRANTPLYMIGEISHLGRKKTTKKTKILFSKHVQCSGNV